MITVTLDPIITNIGHFALRWYGLIVVTAIAIGVWLSTREAVRKGMKPEMIYDIMMWVVPGGLVGARLFHVLDHWSDRFAADPIQALYVWEGGLAIWGGVVGGVLAGILYARYRGWPMARLLDAVAPGLVLAQAVGRLACIITGDAVGKPTDGPFGLAYTSPNAVVPKLGVYYTPSPVYEIIMNLTIFAIIWQLRRKQLPDGALFLIYILLYSGLRFVVTFWSAYKIIAFNLNQTQLISLAVLIIGLPWLVYLLQRRNPTNSVI
ncbi:MAG: Prolipoprotein diacylglyceryl transferase [Anaerolineae bacterium]|nr:Prolipoprotein diacylglyceryl transferase [Anaerolineae bacterium]